MLTSRRLGLRPLQKEDLDLLFALENNAEVRRYFPSGMKSREQTATSLQKFITAYDSYGLPCFALFLLSSGEFIGRAGFGLRDNGETEIGYLLHEKFWGQGYGTESVSTLLDWAKHHLSVEYIVAYADAKNIASLRVMEKCGMQFERDGYENGVLCKYYKIKNSKNAI